MHADLSAGRLCGSEAKIARTFRPYVTGARDLGGDRYREDDPPDGVGNIPRNYVDEDIVNIGWRSNLTIYWLKEGMAMSSIGYSGNLASMVCVST
jgi:hypothetical protein